jgi:hypothetical protein
MSEKMQPHPGPLGMGRSQGPRPGEGRCLCADAPVIRATKGRDRGQVRSVIGQKAEIEGDRGSIARTATG